MCQKCNVDRAACRDSHTELSPNTAVLLRSLGSVFWYYGLPLLSHHSHQLYFWIEQKEALGQQSTVHKLHSNLLGTRRPAEKLSN